ncbi:hypothetical protein NLI96_g10997 [Meripilus lineatus]|uniref:Eukaryotic translation initiation factor 3 subunit K n=1 Tax=Meripilus lineatus TaxID=2056292 RepID=A0AAD5UV04_9APHY|nr:hypothetical protein NLI96_g10997 [Physisporinus lineatus]
MVSASSWVRPATRTDQIENLVSGVGKCFNRNVGLLEDYLYLQIRTEQYDCLANLAILKLYQFNPDLYNPDVVINILIKALTSSPFPDFNLCISLLDDRPPSVNPDEPDPLPALLPLITTLHSLLQQCRFPAFWQLYNSDKAESLRDNYTVECVGFEDAVRDVVIRAVIPAFKRIGSDRLSSYLYLSGDDLIDYVGKLGWTIDQEGVVVIPPNADNTIVSTVVQENVQLPQLTKIITHSQNA